MQEFFQRRTSVAGSMTSANTPSCPFILSLASSTATSSPCPTVTATTSKCSRLFTVSLWQVAMVTCFIPPCHQIPQLFDAGPGQDLRHGGLHLLQRAKDALLHVRPSTPVRPEKLVRNVSERWSDGDMTPSVKHCCFRTFARVYCYLKRRFLGAKGGRVRVRSRWLT